ncbi:ATP-binding protein [Kitasatospora sp. NPDC050543]|uniref:ATP-binding protein n=1 Tax=Kitasatospora sp. NPDC050543 TaxID=3364054 RepID=UPI00379884A2
MPETLDRPPAVASEEACWLPRHRRSASSARHLLRAFLAGRRGGQRFSEIGELLLSELVTNAIEHARVPAGRLIEVRFELREDHLRIEVHDASGEQPTVRPGAAGDDESGRGLLLVRELSTAWGCCPRPGGIGKYVWALLAAADPEVAA